MIVDCKPTGESEIRKNVGESAIKNQQAAIPSIKIRAAQVEPALRTLQFAAALAQLRGAIWTILPRIFFSFGYTVPQGCRGLIVVHSLPNASLLRSLTASIICSSLGIRRLRRARVGCHRRPA